MSEGVADCYLNVSRISRRVTPSSVNGEERRHLWLRLVMDPNPTSPNSHGAGRGLPLLCLRDREPSLEVLRNEAGYEADRSLN